MRLIRRAARGRPSLLDGCVATIGNFDGVHLGHQRIIAHVIGAARERGIAGLAFTFEPTPREFFARGASPARLTRFREKFSALAELGLDCLYCPPFDARMERLSPDEFINRLLVGVLNVRHVVVGDDFRFAHRRSGTVEDLRRAGARYGFSLEHIGSVLSGGERVSSTAIRTALAAGELRRARDMLGRYYSMTGRVVPGLNLGKRLGYPTANVNLQRRASAVAGIFAVRVRGLGPQSLDGVASVGSRPTVEGAGEPLLEVHIFDFDRDIYGACIAVEFIAKLRDEERFPDLASLTAQMHVDAARAREILAAA